ncbi:MAG: hypothetical protein ACJ8FY_09205 [Gemmataceae bacterium]
MVKILLRIFGMAAVVGGGVAAWYGLESADDVRRLEQSIYVQRSQNAYSRSPAAKETGQAKIEEFERGIEKKKTEKNIWFGVAVVALIIGVGIVVLPSSRKRKASVTDPAPVQIPDAPPIA